jgi:hypothetical protein
LIIIEAAAEALTVAGVAGGPAELAPGLGVGGTADPGHHGHAHLPRGQPADQDRDVARRPGPDRRGELGQPGRDRGRLVVGDVVDAGRAVADRRDRRAGRVVDMGERPYAAAAADDREPALAYLRDEVAVGGDAGAGPVEVPVAKRDALDARRPEHRALDVADRLERLHLVGRRARVERVFLGLQAAPGPLIVPVAVALRDEAARPGGQGPLEQVVGALGAQPVGERELPVEVLEAGRPGQPGQLVDDGLRRGAPQRLDDRVPVEGVGDDRVGPHGPQGASLALRAGHRHDLVAHGHQLRNQAPAHRSRRTRDEHLHVDHLGPQSAAA